MAIPSNFISKVQKIHPMTLKQQNKHNITPHGSGPESALGEHFTYVLNPLKQIDLPVQKQKPVKATRIHESGHSEISQSCNSIEQSIYGRILGLDEEIVNGFCKRSCSQGELVDVPLQCTTGTDTDITWSDDEVEPPRTEFESSFENYHLTHSPWMDGLEEDEQQALKPSGSRSWPELISPLAQSEVTTPKLISSAKRAKSCSPAASQEIKFKLDLKTDSPTSARNAIATSRLTMNVEKKKSKRRSLDAEQQKKIQSAFALKRDQRRSVCCLTKEDSCLFAIPSDESSMSSPRLLDAKIDSIPTLRSPKNSSLSLFKQESPAISLSGINPVNKQYALNVELQELEEWTYLCKVLTKWSIFKEFKLHFNTESQSFVLVDVSENTISLSLLKDQKSRNAFKKYLKCIKDLITNGFYEYERKSDRLCYILNEKNKTIIEKIFKDLKDSNHSHSYGTRNKNIRKVILEEIFKGQESNLNLFATEKRSLRAFLDGFLECQWAKNVLLQHDDLFRASTILLFNIVNHLTLQDLTKVNEFLTDDNYIRIIRMIDQIKKRQSSYYDSFGKKDNLDKLDFIIHKESQENLKRVFGIDKSVMEPYELIPFFQQILDKNDVYYIESSMPYPTGATLMELKLSFKKYAKRIEKFKKDPVKYLEKIKKNVEMFFPCKKGEFSEVEAEARYYSAQREKIDDAVANRTPSNIIDFFLKPFESKHTLYRGNFQSLLKNTFQRFIDLRLDQLLEFQIDDVQELERLKANYENLMAYKVEIKEALSVPELRTDWKRVEELLIKITEIENPHIEKRVL